MKKIILSLSACFLYLTSFGQWTAQTSGTVDNLSAVYFTDASNGVAVSSTNGDIFKTSDGGVTWTLQGNATYSLNSVHFGSSLKGSTVGSNGTTYHTTDGGITWSLASSGQGYALNSVFFVNADTCYAVGANGTILKSVNAGGFWSPLTSGTSNTLNGVYFIDKNTGFAVGAAGTILNTTDGGATWAAQTSGSGAVLNSIIFIGGYGYVVGQGGNLLYTTNWGATWVSTASGTTNTLYSIHFADTYHGFASGANGTIIRTNDGGGMWYAQTSGTSNDLNGIFFSDVNNGVAVGVMGTVLKTTDGGCVNPTVTVSGANTICYGTGDLLTASGALDYRWNPNGGNAITYTTSINPIATGSYPIAVVGTSSVGCIDTAFFNLNILSLPSIFTAPNDITCHGLCNGSTSASGTSLTYTWSTGSTATSISGLCAGVYTVSGTDSNGCIDSVTSPIVDPPLLNVSASSSNATCLGVNDGSATDMTTGGTGGYNHTWMPGNITIASPTGLGVGVYTLTVTDAQFCVGTTTVNIASSTNAVLTINNPVTNICRGETTQLTYTVAGATAPFTNNWFDYVQWATICSLDTALLTPMVSGPDTVSLTITDALGCIFSTMKVVQVNVGDSLSGIITEPNLNPVTMGKVYLFEKKTSNLGYDTAGVATINANGTYSFKDIAWGDYFLKAEADTGVAYYPNSIGTYYSNKPNAYQWDSALVITQHSCSGANVSGYTVAIIEITPSLGPGVISGQVTAGTGYGQRMAHPQYGVMGAPLKGVDIKLGKNPGGNAAARTTTDANGNYVFANVPLGMYKIYVDIPNYGMDSVLQISLTSFDSSSTQNNYYVDSLMIRVDTCKGPTVTYTMVPDATPSTWDVFPTYSLTTNAVWYWGDGTSTSGLYPSHTYTAAGWYNICVSVFSGCPDSSNYCQNDSLYRMGHNTASSAMIQINVINGAIGIRSNAANSNSLVAFPNPVTENVIIKSSTELGLITIYNSLGELIFKGKINSTLHQIDLSKQAPGIYILQAQGKQIRLIKE